MKKFLAVVLILALSFTILSLADDTDAADSGLKLYEVKSAGSDEGFSLYNYSDSNIDLTDYSVRNNPDVGADKGSITFTKSLVLEPNHFITIVKSKDDPESKFLQHNTYHVYGTDGIVANSFTMSDKGDDIYLVKGNKIIDAFCYGNVTISDKSLWEGEPYPTMSSKKSNDFAVRVDAAKSSTYGWQRWGITSNFFDPDFKIDAEVTPFTFPESGGIPVYKTIETAQKTVYINMYELTSANMYGLLIELENKGVEVTVLLEKNPVGYSGMKEDAKKMKALVDAGGEIRFIGGDMSRYNYDHAKYCIVDDSKVIVTSENWTKNNLNGIVVDDPEEGKGNRGWGVVVESKQYADFMLTVFTNDFDKTYGDVIDFAEYFPTVTPASLSYTAPTDVYPTVTYSAPITPIMSPESSWDGTLYTIDQAKGRVYAENQSVSSAYEDFTTVESPLKHLVDSSSKGVDVKFILNSTNDQQSVQELIERLNTTTAVSAADMTKPYLHNKGIISDDTCIVTSVNWTPSSLQKNREMCVIIYSAEVTEFYADAFITDFDNNYDFDGVQISISELKSTYTEGDQITATAETFPEKDYEYYWELDGVKMTYDIKRIAFTAEKGDHTLKVSVTVDDKVYGTDKKFTVNAKSGGFDFDEYKQYIIPIAIFIIAIIALALSIAMKGGSRHSGGGRRR